MSWYEVGLHIKKLENKRKEESLLQEFEWLRLRKIWVLMVNYMRDSKVKPTQFKETDLIKLSFDEEEIIEKQKPMTPEEVEAMFPKTINFDKNEIIK